jgi:chromosome segregation ATPase
MDKKAKSSFKLDIKSIVIIVLLGFCLFFGYSWLFTDNSGYKEKVKQLEKEYRELEKKKRGVDIDIKLIREKYDSLDIIDKKLKSDIIKLESEIKKAETEASKSKTKFLELKRELSDTRQKIEDFKKNPPNRTGDALLESLKNKTKQ